MADPTPGLPHPLVMVPQPSAAPRTVAHLVGAFQAWLEEHWTDQAARFTVTIRDGRVSCVSSEGVAYPLAARDGADGADGADRPGGGAG